MMLVAGLLLGALFGAALQLAGATSHTLIVNALRLKDFRIMKLILSAIAVGLIGVHLLDTFGLANMKVRICTWWGSSSPGRFSASALP
ncbi:MAG: hypothetical protein U0361_19860 [Nitrospiraceae bacterium]